MPDYRAAVQQLVDEDRSRLRASVFTAAESNPEQAARAKTLGERVGVPQEVAERNLNEIERQVLTGDIDQATTDTPAARRFYGTPYGAKVGKDDVEVLTEMERTFQRRLQTGQAVQGKIGETVRAPSGRMEPVERSFLGGITEPVQRGYSRGVQGIGMLLDELGVFGGLTRQQAAAAEAAGVSYSPEVERAARFAGQQRQVERFPTPPEIGAALQRIGDAKTFADAASAIADNPRAVIEVVLESFGTSAPALAAGVTGAVVGGPLGSAAGMGAGSFVTEFGATMNEVMGERGLSLTDPNSVRQLLTNPELMAQAREKAVKRAIPIAIFDALSAGLAGRLLAGARGTTASVASRVAGEGALQAGAGAAGETVAQLATDEWKPGDILLEAIAEIPTAFVEAPANFRDTLRNAQAAEDRANFIDNVNKLATASKVAQRDAASFEQFVAQAAEDGPVQEVYVDAQVLNQLGLAEKLAEISPSVAQQFATALATGGDVVIPVAEYAARVAPTDLAQGLLDHLRTAPDELSRAEAQEFMQSAPERFQQELERITSQAANTVGAQLGAETVKQNLLDQLNTANRFTKDVNEAYASLAASFYATTASRFGVTPEQMYERYPMRVQGAKPEGDALPQTPAGEQQFTTTYTDREGRAYDVRLQQQILGRGTDRALGVRVVVADPGTNAYRGYVDFEVNGNTLRAANVAVAPGSRRRGIAEAMYRAAREAGYDIAPGRVQTADGMAMVNMLRERGLINREVDDTGEVLNQSVSTRLPTAKKSTENPLESMLVVGLESSKADPKAFEKNVELIRQYPNFRDNKSASTPDKAAEQFIRHVVDNLLWLHDQVPADTRQRSKLWYDGARAIAEQWASKYSISEAQAAGMLAVLSPQKDWFQNVSLAERVLDALTNQADTAWTEEMSQTAAGLAVLDPESLGEINGKTLRELEGNAYLQAMWVRVYDQTYNERGYRVVSPEGNFGEWVVNADGETRSKTAWGSFNEIGKAISIFYDGSVSNISASLGEQHKVRNFYNNIFAPASEHGDVTIDTHAVAAGLLRPLSGSATEVLHNFGAGGAASSSIFGSKGTYGIYAEAYRRAARERSVLPREMQSITWEAVRGLYTAPFKAQASNVAAVDAVWDQYKRRRISLDEARNRILELAGGIAAPEWQRPGDAGTQTPWASSYTDELRPAGGPAGAAGRGAGSDGAGSTGQGGVNGRSEQTRDGGGGYSAGGLAPLPGAPSVAGASGPDPRLVAVAEQYAASIGVDLRRPAEYVVVDEQRAARIAEAYAAMPHAPQDPAVQEAYQNLIAQTVAQYRALEAAGYRFYLFDEGNDPYAGNPWNAMRDLRANQTMGVFATEAGFGSGASDLDVSNNPLMADTGIEWPYGGPDGPMKRVLANDLFRAVHDAFGHGLEGAGFRAQGEENAWQAHVRLFTGSAVGAITSETRGQNSWLNYGPYGATNRNASVEDTVFADQKTGLMPEWTWTEGRAPDMDDGSQAEQRRMRQALDLDLLQQAGGDTLAQSAPRVEQTETPSFKAWFGDSKVVDAEGKPLVVYHGTARDFVEFRSTSGGSLGAGIYFTPSADAAGRFAERSGDAAQIVPVYVKAERILDLDTATPEQIQALKQALPKTANDLLQYGYPARLAAESEEGINADLDRIQRNAGFNPQALSNALGQVPTEVLARVYEVAGYDAVARTSTGLVDQPAFREIAVFRPTQIKSAIGNSGTFDANDPNILNQEVKPGEVAVTGLHFSRQARATVNGAFYGTGLRGAERDRVFNGDDQRLRNRVYFYVDEGKGVVPEAGVGGVAHSAELSNLYDIGADPLKLAAQGGGVNAIESRILDAGFDGYYRPSFANNAGVAVVIGPASRSIPVTRIDNPVIGTTGGGQDFVEPTVRVQLSGEQLDALNAQELQAAGAVVERSFIAVRPSTISIPESRVEALRPTLSAVGVDLPAPAASAAALAQNEGVRGTFSPSTLTITLLEKADLSTFLHETGHFFLEALADMAAQPNAPADVAADMGKVLEWFGVKDLQTWRSMSLSQQRKYHEKFAESFEQYLFEGKAPSKDLQPLFSRFRAWLTSVYRSLQAFMGSYNTQLSDEVRSVFDRLLATQDQIEELEATRGFAPIFTSAQEAGMTPQEWAAYQGTNAEATEDAMAALQSRSLRDLRWVVNARSRELKRISKDVAEKRKAVEAEVRDEVKSEPVFAVQRWLKTGVMPDGTKTVGAKLATPALREMYGDNPAAPWRYLATNMIAAEEGMHPDVVAEMFGFSSGDEMVRAIVSAFPEDSEIQGRTDQRMLERYGDLVTPAGQARAAEEAVHNEARARMVATELAALAKATTPARKMMAAAKQFATTLVARKKVKELKPAQHTAAETKAAKRAAQASVAGKTQEAITAKRDQLLNFYAARETIGAQAEVEKGLKYLTKVGDSTTLSPDYKEQIDALLERFDLRRSVSNRALEKRQALLEWVESQREMGVEPSIPPELLNEAMRKSYKDMTVEEFRGLIDTVKQIEHLGRLKQKLLTAKDQRDFDAVRDLMVDSILENAGDRQADTRTPNTVLGSALLGMKKFWSAHIKAATWARVMDGGKDGGPVWEYLIRAANAAGDMEIERRAQATRDITDLLAPVLKLGPMGGKGMFIPAIGRSMNREARLAVALNTGNASNMQRLMGGEGWSAEQVQAITASLTEAEWRFVQKVWDYFEGFRPEIGAKEKRVTGVEPNWIEATPLQVQTADGKVINLRGGYYPVKYDPRASERAEAHDEAETAKQMMRGAYTSATTRRSFTKDRADEVTGRPLLYSLDGIYNGVNEVIHDLSWHEFLIDANRLIRDQKIAAAMRQKYGPEAHQQFKTWLQDTAVGDRPAQNAGESAAAWVRQGVSVAGLGFNIMSALIQPLGITQSIVRVGPQYIARGVSQFIAGPFSAVKMVEEKSSFMANRAKTRYRELAEVRGQVKGQTKARRAIDGAAYFLMLRAQQTVDIPTWIGAYEKAISEGNNDERAVALADQAVIDAQGGGTMKDLSAIERGGPVQKLFTVFYSFFNAALNMGAVQTMTAKSKPKLAADYLLLYVLPVVLGAFLKDALTPGDSGDDEPEELMGKLIAEQISYLTGLMFGVREIGPAIQTVAGVNQYPMGYSGPAGLRPINDLYKLAQQVNQGEADEGLRKAIVNTAGSLLRLPAAQINRSITGVQALADGKTDNPAAVVFGYQEPQ